MHYMITYILYWRIVTDMEEMLEIKVFIDGGHGTTGLEIRERLADRDDIEILDIDESLRKDLAARVEMTKSRQM